MLVPKKGNRRSASVFPFASRVSTINTTPIFCSTVNGPEIIARYTPEPTCEAVTITPFPVVVRLLPVLTVLSALAVDAISNFTNVCVVSVAGAEVSLSTKIDNWS